MSRLEHLTVTPLQRRIRQKVTDILGLPFGKATGHHAVLGNVAFLPATPEPYPCGPECARPRAQQHRSAAGLSIVAHAFGQPTVNCFAP